jgi:aminopeptidase-like protein
MKAYELENYFDQLWPICRSITGNGLRHSFHLLQELVPFELTEVPSGTPVFDWIVPQEWNISDAYILDASGKKWADFKVNNLHIVGYSVPVHEKMNFEQLAAHLHTLPSQPDAIPYITSYYKPYWGFCLSHDEFLQMPKEGLFEVVINSSLTQGSMTYGEAVLEGNSDEEVLFSSYLCHPSMANNELSGPLALAGIYQRLKALTHRKYTYRFVLAPETIGVIAFLAQRGEHLKQRLKAGYVLTCCGDSGPFHYKRSKIGESAADRAAEHVLRYKHPSAKILPFSVGGSDERQYCSPGFNLPVGSLMRTPYQQYSAYHTSKDDKNFISFSALEETIDCYLDVIEALEMNATFYNEVQYCEPNMGKRGLYPSAASPDIQRAAVHRMMHLLSYCDGQHDLLSIADKRNEGIWLYKQPVENCMQAGLLRPC